LIAHILAKMAEEVDEEQVEVDEEVSEEISEETNSEKSESADIEKEENEEDLSSDESTDAESERREKHTDEALGGGFEPAKDYAGQGASDERARGSFDRDESIEGRHEVFESPQEMHEEDHEGQFDEDDVEMAESAESLETDENVESDPEDLDDDEVAEIDEEVDAISESVAEEDEEQAVIVPEINENREMADQPLTIDNEEEEEEESAAGYSEDTMKDYAGQGASDERARGSFDRDESIDGRHDVFESPQEVHEEDHEGLFDENDVDQPEEEEEVVDDEESAAGNGAGDTNSAGGEEEEDLDETAEEEVDDSLKAEIVLEADNTDSHGRDHGGFYSDGNGVADGGNKELVSVHGARTPKKVTRHSAGHWLLSMALFVLMMATLSVVAIHFMQKCNADKVAAHDPEYTPLISDKV